LRKKSPLFLAPFALFLPPTSFPFDISNVKPRRRRRSVAFAFSLLNSKSSARHACCLLFATAFTSQPSHASGSDGGAEMTADEWLFDACR
jgi:hypothetical protein